jgi:hypothetical protein
MIPPMSASAVPQMQVARPVSIRLPVTSEPIEAGD